MTKVNITEAGLKRKLAWAARGGNATLSGVQLRALLEIVAPLSGRHKSVLERLHANASLKKVKVSAEEMRSLLELALNAKRRSP